MTKSLVASTVEAHAAKAGIPDKNGALTVEADRFVVTTGSGEYVARFEKCGEPVEQFTSDTLGRHLTREEASDVITLIKGSLPIADRLWFSDVLARLENNLPSLGFSTETPLMGTAKTTQAASANSPRQQNARQWQWTLANE